MKNTLHQYIAQHNSWNAIFDSAHVDIDIKTITEAQARTLINKLDAEMSPENLHCDGEISHSQAQAKYRFYKLVADELADYAHHNGLQMRELYEL